MKIKTTGIVMAKYDVIPAPVHIARASLPNQAKPLTDDHLHITLCVIPQADRPVIKGFLFEDLPEITLLPDLKLVERSDRMAWVLRVDDSGQRLLRQYVDKLGLVLAPYEASRPFHVSVANLTGNPFDSVGDIKPDEI